MGSGAIWNTRHSSARASPASFRTTASETDCCPSRCRPEQVERIQTLCFDPELNRLYIDLRTQLITLADGVSIPFSVDELRRDDLLNGRDPIASTLRFAADIHGFERRHWSEHPWLEPPAPHS